MIDYNEIYDKLVEHYNVTRFGGKRKLDKKIEKLMKAGYSWEEALEEIYFETFGEKVSEKRVPREEKISDLQLKLEELKGEGGYTYLYIFIFMLILPIFLAAPPLAILIFFFLFIFLLIAGLGEVEWRFNETILLKDSSRYLRDIMNIVPEMFREILLKDISVERSEDMLKISMYLGKSVLVESKGGSSMEYVDVGPFYIKSIFTRENNDIRVDIEYWGKTSRKNSPVAAEIYEKIVVGYRSALNKAFEKARESMTRFTFKNLIEMIGRKGIVLSEIRCPHCGAPIKLPEKGDVVECPYCGTVIKAVDILKIFRSL